MIGVGVRTGSDEAWGGCGMLVRATLVVSVGVASDCGVIP